VIISPGLAEGSPRPSCDRVSFPERIHPPASENPPLPGMAGLRPLVFYAPEDIPSRALLTSTDRGAQP